MQWAGLETPKLVAVHQRVKYRGDGRGENSCLYNDLKMGFIFVRLALLH